MPLRTLIIEDEPLIQKSLELMFSKEGHEVQVTSLGKDALEKILHQNFDIIITDLMLNDISGFDILEGSLKKYSRQELSSKFVIISAYSSSQITEKAGSYGCLFLSKPFDDIRDTVKTIIKRFQNEN